MPQRGPLALGRSTRAVDLTFINAFFANSFTSGQAVNAVLAVTLVQTLVFALMAKGWRARFNVFFSAAPGVSLIMAVRAAVLGAAWWEIGFWLLLSWPLYLMDLSRRPP
jgi:hypothetical protein